MNILDYFECHIFASTKDNWKQKYGNKKEGFQSYLKFSFNSILNIITRSRKRALDPNFPKKQIDNTDFYGP